MANFKIRFSYVADNEADFVQKKTDDASLNAIKEQQWDRNRALIESMDNNENAETSPQKVDTGTVTTLENGKKQLTIMWDGFGSEADATTFSRVFVTHGNMSTINAYHIANDIRTKIEILDDSDALVTKLHDNTTLEVKSVAVDYTDAAKQADPFFLPE